ncbi:MAG: hypothetical protein KUG67_00485 [Proteobacteria bacterium]|nr:hypothetical protein [Pseudomonadota bacterium]
MSILSDELALPAYAATTSEQAANLLNAKTIAAFQPITTHDMQQYLVLVDQLLEIEACTSDACKKAVRAMEIFDSFDVTNPAILAKLTAVLDALVSETAISFAEGDKAVILSLGNDLISRAEQLGIRVTTGQIQDLRGEV